MWGSTYVVDEHQRVTGLQAQKLVHYFGGDALWPQHIRITKNRVSGKPKTGSFVHEKNESHFTLRHSASRKIAMQRHCIVLYQEKPAKGL